MIKQKNTSDNKLNKVCHFYLIFILCKLLILSCLQIYSKSVYPKLPDAVQCRLKVVDADVSVNVLCITKCNIYEYNK